MSMNPWANQLVDTMSFRTIPHIVGRENEIRELVDRLADLRCGRAVQYRLVNLYGDPGVGKTTLLGALGAQIADSIGLHTVSITLGAATSDGDAAQQVIRDRLQPILPDAVVADLAQLGQALTQAPALLLIDCEVVQIAAVMARLEQFLTPLIRAARALIVIASPTPLRWRHFENRRVAQALELHALTPAESAAQLQCAPDQAAAIFELSAGLPLANELLRPLLAAQPAPERWSPEEQRRVAAQIPAAIYRQLQVQLSTEQHQAIEILALLRVFYPTTLAHFVGADVGAPDAWRQERRQAELLRDLVAAALIRWDQDDRRYRILPPLRHLIARALRLHDPQRCARIAQLSLQYVQHLVEAAPLTRDAQFIEYLYHHCASSDTSGSPQVFFRQLVQRHYVSPDGRRVFSAGIDGLRRRLASDPDLPALLQQRGARLADLLEILNDLPANAD